MFLPVVLGGSVRGGAAAFDPTTLTGYVDSPYSIAALRGLGKLWQDTAKTVVASADGDPVRVVVCGSTDYTAPSDAARPLLYSEGSGKWSLSFDGVDDVIRASYTLNQPYTRGAVWRHSSPQNNSTVMLDSRIGDTAYLNFPSTNTVGMYGSTPGPSATAINNTWYYTAEVFNEASAKLYLNNDAATTGDTGSASAGGLAMGANGSGNYPCVCRLAAVLVSTGEVTGSELAIVRSYLAALAP